MNRPVTTLTFIVAAPDQETRTLTVPRGEAAYWAQVGISRAGALAVIPNEIPQLPYLGQIACPDDNLARLWLADQHGAS